MAQITFSKDEKEHLVRKLQSYFESELDQSLGQFEADFLLDFISKEIGSYHYNQGLKDAQAVISMKIDDVTEAIDEIIKPTDF